MLMIKKHKNEDDFDGLNVTEKRISELEDLSIETSQTEN
jgi:hypothetical protein